MSLESGFRGEPEETRDAAVDESVEGSRDVLLAAADSVLKRIARGAGISQNKIAGARMESVPAAELDGYRRLMEATSVSHLPGPERAWRLSAGDVAFVFRAVSDGLGENDDVEFRGEFFRTDAAGNPIESLGGDRGYGTEEIASVFRSNVTPKSLKKR